MQNSFLNTVSVLCNVLCRVESHLQILELVTDYNLQENEFFFDRHIL